MTKNNRKGIVPSYIDNFKCVGEDCEDSCCQSWTVYIDKTTYKKYAKLGLTKNIKRSKKNSDFSYAKITLDDHGKCPFLQDSLCGIQKKYGESLLSSTCHTYPRKWNYIDGRVEVSGTLSCPELARNVLLQEDGIILNEKEVEYVSPELLQVKLLCEPTRNKLFHIHDVRLFILSLLQYRKYNISERLWILGMFISEYEKLDDNGEQVQRLIQQYITKIESMTYKNILDQFPNKTLFLLKWFTNFQNLAFSKYNNKRFIECNEAFRHGMGLDLEGIDDNRIIERYEELKTKYFDPFIKENEYLFENFVVHFVYTNVMPYNDAKISPFSQYMELMINVTLLNVYLIGISGSTNGLSTELVVKVVQTLSRKMAHSATLIPLCINSLKANGVNNMSAATICIKL